MDQLGRVSPTTFGGSSLVELLDASGVKEWIALWLAFGLLLCLQRRVLFVSSWDRWVSDAFGLKLLLLVRPEFGRVFGKKY